MISTERLTDLFVDVADTLVADFDLVDFLHNLTDHAADVSGAAAVGLMLVEPSADAVTAIMLVVSDTEAAMLVITCAPEPYQLTRDFLNALLSCLLSRVWT